LSTLSRSMIVSVIRRCGTAPIMRSSPTIHISPPSRPIVSGVHPHK
jgi:hypothetical protein